MTVKPYPAYKASGVAWIGDLPWAWGDALQLRHLAACLDSRRIPLNSAERADMPGDVPYWGSGGVVGSVGRPLFDEELVLLGEDGAPFYDRSRPVSFRVEGPTWVNNHIHVLRPRKHINPAFLVYALNSVDYSLYISGSTRDKLTQDDMWSIRVPVPSFSQQRQIADYLDAHTTKIDTLIGKQERLIETLAERRQAVISHAVTKGLDPNAPMKDSGVAWLGSLPESWTAFRLKHVASVQTGLTLGKTVASSEAVELPYLRVANVQTSGVNLDEVKTLLVDRAEWAKYRLRDGDVLMTEGGDIDKLGRGCLWGNQIDPCVHQNHVFAVRCGRKINSRMLVYLLDAQVARNYFRMTAKKTTNLASTNSTTLGNLPIALPQTSEQERIVEHLDRETAQIDALAAKAREMIDVLKERRQALISAAVTGKIDVRGLS